MATRSASRAVPVCAAFSLVTCAVAQPSHAAFVGPTSWSRPATLDQATTDRTTYQEWQRFSSAAGPNGPNDGITGDSTATFALDGLFYANPNDGTGAADDANAFDAASGTSGAFVTSGGNIYSPGGVIKPRVVFDGYDSPGGRTQFVINLRTLGGEITVADAPGITALAVNGTSVQGLPGYHYERLFSEPFGGPGGNRVDHRWTFTAPEAASFTLDWHYGAPSASFDAVTVDTLTTVPEPTSLAALLTATVLLARRSRRANA